ncbi:MAG TPA: hypothetical protein V6C76_11780 [Drouetiella sp.]
MSQIRTIDCYFVFDNTYLPMLNASVSKASNGSQSTVRGKTSITMLQMQGVDIFQSAQSATGAPVEVYVVIDGQSSKLFGGTIDEFEPDFDNDSITFSGRDYASSIVDTKETTSSVDYKNQTIGQMVTNIANKFGYTPKVTDPGIMAGAQMYDDSAYMPHGQQYWTMLQDLARQCGYECFVTDNKELFFGTTDSAGGNDVTVNHAPDVSNSTDVENPICDLKPVYQPGRNSNIRVIVVSHHPVKVTQRIKSSYQGNPFKGRAPKSNKDYLIGKSNTSGTQSAKSGGTQPSDKPAVVVRKDGLTQERADALAQSIAKDIAKRQLVLKGKCPMGLPDAQVHSKLTLKEGGIDLLGFANADYVIASLDHEWDAESGSFVTSVTALNHPEVQSVT